MEAMAESLAPQRGRLATRPESWSPMVAGAVRGAGAGTVVTLLPCPTAEVPPAEPGVLHVAPTRSRQD